MILEQPTGGNVEKPKGNIIAREPSWADDIKKFRDGYSHPWKGSQIDKAYAGIEFRFVGSPGKPITDTPESELLAMDNDPNHQLTPDMQRDVQAIRAHKSYATKYPRPGVTLDGWKVKDHNRQIPSWIDRAIVDASRTVFRDIPAICDYFRAEAEKNREN